MNKRYEIKYVINKEKFNDVYFDLLKKFKFIKDYPDRIVNSLYYDDFNLNSLLDNISGNSKREKYRLRWYGDFKSMTNVIFEIKQKHNKMSSKILNKLNHKTINKEDIKILFNNQNVFKKYFNQNFFKTFFFEKKNNFLVPQLFVSYHRQYFKLDNNLRITFDNAISYKHYDLSLNNWYEDNVSIIEIKCDFKKLDYYVDMLKTISLTSNRSSKYVKGMSIFNKTNYF